MILLWAVEEVLLVFYIGSFTRAYDAYSNNDKDAYILHMRRYFVCEAMYQIPTILLNMILAYMIMSFNRPLPNKVDLILNREISLLVLLKNKIVKPDLFGLHNEKRRSIRKS